MPVGGALEHAGDAQQLLLLEWRGEDLLTLPTAPPWTVRLTLREERRGRFHGTLGDDLSIVGIWKYERGRPVLCFRSAKRAYLERFSDEERQDLIALMR